MSHPKTSVLLPTYNRAHLISIAIRSVLAQTDPDFELLVIDDGSTDGTEQVVKEFTDRRIHYHFQENRGISATLNAGIRAARGEYIARIDSDDRWKPELLEREVPILRARPEVGLVYAKAQAMDQEGRLLAQVLGAPLKYPGDTFKSLVYGDVVCTITAIIRRTCLEKTGLFDETMTGNEDWDMWIRLARITRFVFLDEVLAHFRMHPGRTTGGSSRHFEAINQGLVQVLDKVFNQADLPPEVHSIKNLAYRNIHFDVGLRWLSVGNRRQANAHFSQAFRFGGNPAATLARLAYLILLYRFLSKHSLGIRMVEGLVRARRRFASWQGRRGT